MAFQVDVAQPAAAARWRLDAARTYVAGSSLGGLVSYRLAWAYPEVYAGAASLSGAFWYGKAEGHGMRDVVLAEGARDVALYLDHGGTFADGGDDLPNSVELRDLLEDEGFAIATSPACTAGPRALCYHHEPGATHDELAWRARAWRFLSYLLPPG
jgi:predicted alpha/beta superfamily hydrolase